MRVCQFHHFGTLFRQKHPRPLGGADQVRTDDPHNAIVVLCQLSYDPATRQLYRRRKRKHCQSYTRKKDDHRFPPQRFLSVNRNTINAYYNEIRKRIFQYSLKEQKKELGEFEFKLDESCFRARRSRGKREHEAADKTLVFGLLKRNGKVFVTFVSNCSK